MKNKIIIGIVALTLLAATAHALLSPPSNIASATTPQATPPTPTTLVATAVSTNQINLTWSSSANNVVGVLVQRSTTGVAGSFSTIYSNNTFFTSYSDTSCQPATTYYYQVINFN